MYNWFEEKDVIIRQTVKTVTRFFRDLLEDVRAASANYWISNRHNIFAEVETDSDKMSILIKLEIYDDNNNCIGDLFVVDTKDMSRKSLRRAVTEIVKYYYGEV